ncbi:MAG TPA: TIGR04295 family B12-binding domain-containing radical SAM protein [Clostridia bacterium]|nr:TIGR04295 family B12-binding domain-containing radical SAM protein [Clostridia bacterium]
MRYALVNPNWNFEGSTYFGCRDPHTPLELLFAFDKVREARNDAVLVDAQTDDLTLEQTRERVGAFDPDFLVIPSAPSYLFWRCPPPELRVPIEWFAGIGGRAKKVLIGPHASATPSSALRKTGADVVLRGEPDQAIADLASMPWSAIDGCCYRDERGEHISASLGVVDMRTLKALDFDNYNVEAHRHRHHVFFGQGRGAELEFARGCPWACTFCNKTLFRNKFRERDVSEVLIEVDRLIARGVDYIYFIDEIFGVGKNVRRLLEGIAERNVQIGFQTRIDLWDEETLDLLGRARCISMECGIESITEEGRDELNKNCRMGTERITELLIYARQRIPWVQANLILTEKDDKEEIRLWQENLKAHGVWVSEPVPMFPFPGSPLYVQTFGALPDDDAWERAHSFYTSIFNNKGYSDIQEQRPVPLVQLETSAAGGYERELTQSDS